MVVIKQQNRNTWRIAMEGGLGGCFRYAETLATLYKKGWRTFIIAANITIPDVCLLT